MGIQGLNELLRKKSSGVFKDVHISTFSGKRIAIDLPIVVMRHFSIQWKKYITSKINIVKDTIDPTAVIKPTISAVKNELHRLRSQYLISLIIVLEGESPTEKKLNAGQRRFLVREKTRKNFENELATIPEGFDLLTLADIEKYEVITKLAVRYAQLPDELYSQLADALINDKYCILKATGEAEELCTELCITGKVDGVYSTDTDCIVRKCPVLITKINETGVASITTYNNDVLKDLNLSYEQFVDMAILTQCDYNTGIPRVGIMTAHKCMQQYGSLEALEQDGKYNAEHIAQLNYKKCRELLHNRPVEESCEDISPLDNLVALSPEDFLITPN